MSSNTKHTPGPLVASGNRVFMGAAMERREVAVATKADPVIRHSADANAAEIAHRWNLYPDLLAALRALVGAQDAIDAGTVADCLGRDAAIGAARAAIARAEGRGA